MPRKSSSSRRRFLKKALSAAYAAPLIVSLPANASVTRSGSGRQARAKTAITPGLGQNQGKWGTSTDYSKSKKSPGFSHNDHQKHSKR